MTAYARAPRTASEDGYTRTLPRTPHSARAARELVRTALAAWGLDGLADAATVLVSELVGNAVEHTMCHHIRVTITRTSASAVRIAVVDKSHVLPVRRDPDDSTVHGRGLILVEALTDRWGTDPLPWGKRVWIELSSAGDAS